MPQFATDIIARVPESMKTPAFGFTAFGLLLYIAATDPFHFLSDRDPTQRSSFYNVGFFVLWGLAFNAALASCERSGEWVRLVKFVRERVLRQRNDHDNNKPDDEKRDDEKRNDEKPNGDKPVQEEEHLVSVDALMLAPYVIAMITSIDALIRTVKGDKSEQHAIAIILARGISTLCVPALWGPSLSGPTFRRHGNLCRITVRPTNLRSDAWVVLFVVSTLASVLNWFK
jgi:hypothetical protein